jgi:hypothetical protein
MSTIKFTCTSFDSNQKKGVLKPDENGYYELPVGGLNVLNSAGQWYDYDGAKSLFESSSQLMRRVKRGALRGEVGHPAPKPGQSEDEYAMRILTIDEKNVCAHFAELYLNFNDYKSDDGKPIIAIMAKVAPSGPYAAMLQSSLDNPRENVCFSIRAFTADYYERNRYMRVLKNVVTFDYVNEPGIHIAEKFKSPSLESRLDKVVTRNQMQRAILTNSAGLAKESFTLTPDELFASLGWSTQQNNGPAFAKW